MFCDQQHNFQRSKRDFIQLIFLDNINVDNFMISDYWKSQSIRNIGMSIYQRGVLLRRIKRDAEVEGRGRTRLVSHVPTLMSLHQQIDVHISHRFPSFRSSTKKLQFYIMLQSEITDFHWNNLGKNKMTKIVHLKIEVHFDSQWHILVIKMIYLLFSKYKHNFIYTVLSRVNNIIND